MNTTAVFFFTIFVLLQTSYAYYCYPKNHGCNPYDYHTKCCDGLTCKPFKSHFAHGKKYLCVPEKVFIEFNPPFANCSEIFNFPLPPFTSGDAFEKQFLACEPLVSGFSNLVYTPFCLTDCNGKSKEPLRFMRDSTYATGSLVSADCMRQVLPVIYPYSDGNIPYCNALPPGQAPPIQADYHVLKFLSHCSGIHVTAAAFQFLDSDPSKADEIVCVT